ncbi:MAG: arginase family protein [Acidobacteriota bacterium]
MSFEGVDLIHIPYDTGRRGWRMGAGPERLAEVVGGGALTAAGVDARARVVEADVDPPTETSVAFDLAARISAAVKASRASARLPLVLAGNCMSALGTVAGLGADRTAVVWFDAHGDLNTPETTTSGFLDGMAVAALTGRCWRRMTEVIPDFVPLPDRRVALVGVRDVDDGEEHLLRGSSIPVVTTGQARSGGMRQVLEPVLGRVEDDVTGAYVHLDLDVLDPGVGRANAFAAPGGLEVEEVVTAVETIVRRTGVVGAAMTAYDPTVDADGSVAEAADRIAAPLLDGFG